MKKVIEVKRGDPIPSNAKWLKDILKQVGTKSEWYEDGMSQGYQTVPTYGTFDVFEVPLEEEKYESKVPVVGRCEDCGGRDYGHFREHTYDCPRNPF